MSDGGATWGAPVVLRCCTVWQLRTSAAEIADSRRFVRQVPGTDICPDTAVLTEVFLGFPQSLQANIEIIN